MTNQYVYPVGADLLFSDHPSWRQATKQLV